MHPPSGPVALWTSNVVKSCATPSQFLAIGDMSGKGGPYIGRGNAAVSYVNTDVKHLLRMSVFIV